MAAVSTECTSADTEINNIGILKELLLALPKPIIDFLLRMKLTIVGYSKPVQDFFCLIITTESCR